MKRILTLLAVLTLALPLFGAEPKTEEINENRAFKNKVFDIHNRNVRDLAEAVHLLGSGFKGAGIMVNSQLRTITVRDFPENLAAIEEALKRLDKTESTPDVTLNLAVIIGSKSPLPNSAPLPDDLLPVLKQLQATLRYSTYGLLTATMHRTKAGTGVTNSGVAEPALVGIAAKEGKPIFYTYTLRDIAVGENTVGVGDFEFNMRVPIDSGNGGTQYESVGFHTPVTIRQNEKVVIGTTTMGDKALIVVVTATVGTN